MLFATLDVVLRGIGARVDVPESARIADLDDPVWMQNINEFYFRYSKAAGLFDHHLVTSNTERLPRWFDIRDGTGYPRPNAAAQEEGISFMVEQARWYPGWLKFNREFRARSMSAGGRWGGPPTEADYARECPPLPSSSEQFSKRIHEIGFDVADIIAFLDRSEVPHALRLDEEPEKMPRVGDGGKLQDSNVRVPPSATGDGPPSVGSTSSGTPGNRTATRGRRCPIEKAIHQARLLAAPAGDDVEAVFEQLIKLARECPKDFPPLSRYENGQVLYGHVGYELQYTRRALAAFLGRRKTGTVETTDT